MRLIRWSLVASLSGFIAGSHRYLRSLKDVIPMSRSYSKKFREMMNIE